MPTRIVEALLAMIEVLEPETQTGFGCATLSALSVLIYGAEDRERVAKESRCPAACRRDRRHPVLRPFGTIDCIYVAGVDALGNVVAVAWRRLPCQRGRTRQ